jgi:hypothetical protein
MDLEGVLRGRLRHECVRIRESVGGDLADDKICRMQTVCRNHFFSFV